MRISNYGIAEIFENVVNVIRTKIQFPRARMIRFPIVVRGKKYMDFGNNLTTGRYCRFEVNGRHESKKLIFGENVNIGDNVRIACAEQINIGSNVLMGSKVLIIDNIHGSYTGKYQDAPSIPPNKRMLTSRPIKIEDNVWIGEGVVIQGGVTIGEGSIVAANSVVTKNVERGTIVGGVPIKVIKRYNEHTLKWESEQ